LHKWELAPAIRRKTWTVLSDGRCRSPFVQALRISLDLLATQKFEYTPGIQSISHFAARPHGGSSMAAHLRVFPSSSETDYSDLPAPTVGVRFGELLPLIALAQRKNCGWLRDFLDDEVRVTSDLYEVLRAFRSYRPSA
jgi:hypothetical protein